MGLLRVSQEVATNNDTHYKAAELPAKAAPSPAKPQDSLTSLERVETKTGESSILDTISKSISNLFTNAYEWVWGKSTSKIMPADVKTEDGEIESISSRPRIEKPNQELQRYLDIEKQANSQVERIQDSNADQIKSELTDQKWNDAVIMKLLMEILKESALSSEREVMLANQRLKTLQLDLEIIRKEKNAHDDQTATYQKVADIAAKVGIVTVALSVGGLIVAGAFIVTGGVAAVPMAVVVANSLVGLAGAFNAVADIVIKDKLNTSKGQSYLTQSREQEVMVQRKFTLDELLDAYKDVSEARKLMAAEIKKQHYAISNLK